MLVSYYLLTFNDPHEIMRFKSKATLCRMVPTPAKLAAKCGMSLKVDVSAFSAIRTALKAENIQYDKIYLVNKDGLKVEYQEVKKYE